MPALIVASYLSLFVLGLLDNSRGPFYPDILKDLGLTYTHGSLFFAVSSFATFIGSLRPFERLKVMASVPLLILSGFILGSGFGAISFAPNLWLLILASATFGFGLGAMNVAQNSLIYEVASAKRRRQLLSGLHSMYGLASLIAPVVASLLIWAGLNWRSSFLLLAALPLVMAVVVWKYFGLKGHSHSDHDKKAKLTRKELVACLIFCLMMAGYLWGEISVSTRLVLWLRTEKGMDPDMANFHLSGFFILLLLGRLGFSAIHLEMSNLRVLSISAGLASLFYFAGLFHHPLWLVGSGLAMAPFYPSAMDQVNQQFGSKSSQALGIVLGIGSLSVVFMHLTIGWVGERFGLTTALSVNAYALAAVTLALLVQSFSHSKGAHRRQ